MAHLNKDFGEAFSSLLRAHDLTYRSASRKAGGSPVHTTIMDWAAGLIPGDLSRLYVFLDLFPRDEAVKCLRSGGLALPPYWAQPEINEVATVRIPIIGVIRAGEPVLAVQNIEDYELVSPSEAANGEYFYLRVQGDSMENAWIPDGSIVYVRRQDNVDNRDIAVVMANGDDATIKRVLKSEDGIILQPESSNPEHVAQFYPKGHDVKIIGLVIHAKIKII